MKLFIRKKTWIFDCTEHKCHIMYWYYIFWGGGDGERMCKWSLSYNLLCMKNMHNLVRFDKFGYLIGENTVQTFTKSDK